MNSVRQMAACILKRIVFSPTSLIRSPSTATNSLGVLVCSVFTLENSVSGMTCPAAPVSMGTLIFTHLSFTSNCLLQLLSVLLADDLLPLFRLCTMRPNLYLVPEPLVTFSQSVPTLRALRCHVSLRGTVPTQPPVTVAALLLTCSSLPTSILRPEAVSSSSMPTVATFAELSLLRFQVQL